MTRQLGRLAAGAGATAALLAVLAGLPAVLYRFGGSPLPRHLPGWHSLAAALGSRDEAGLLLPAIRDCAWLGWLAFACCVLAEVVALGRGGRAPSLHLRGLQGAAGRLVALSAVLFSAPPALTLSAHAAAVTQHEPRPGAQPAADAGYVTASGGPAERVAGPVVTVRPGECLWQIAQRYLGAGDKYPQVVQLNYGHPMGDGEVFTDASLIRPGWRLQLPADALAAPGPAAPAPARHPGHPSSDPGFQRQHPAARVPSPAPPASSAHAPATAPAPAVHGQTGTRHGQLPDAGFFVTGALAGSVLTTVTRMRLAQRQHRRNGRRIPLPHKQAVRALEQRLRAVPATGPLSTLREALACLEGGIAGRGQVPPDIVGLHVTPAQLQVLLSAPAADAPPPPFEISPARQGMCWQLPLPASAPLAQIRDCDVSHLLPGLFTVGATSDGYLLLDLEAMQVTGCDGPSGMVRQVVTTVATELATGQWSGWYDLILVGCDELSVLSRAQHCAALDEALAVLESRRAAFLRRLEGRAPADLRQLRLAEPDNEDWGLTVLVSAEQPEPEQLKRLLALTDEGPGAVAALVAGDGQSEDGRMAPTVLQLAADEDLDGGIVANVVPLQVTARPRALSAADYDAIAALLSVAADTRDVAPDEPPYEFHGAPPWLGQAAEPARQPDVTDVPWPPPGEPGDDQDEEQDSWQDEEPPGEGPSPGRPAGPAGQDAGLPADGPRGTGGERLELRILGPFAVAGAGEPLPPTQAELLLALALAAPGGLTNSALGSLLGADPDHPRPPDTIRQIIARTRRRLGPAGDGQEFVANARDGRYYLHPDVVLDWTQFRALAASGRAEDLRAALALVSGQPFTGSYYWWLETALVETVRAAVVDAAELLAQLELEAGASRAAARAARTGLMAEAAAEQLWRLVMRAEHAAGNSAGVAEAWRLCLDAIEDVAPGGQPHPDTAALYWQLASAARLRSLAR